MMRKFTATVMIAMLMANSVCGAEISVKLDNENIEFESQQPVIADGRTLIPLRGVFEKIGYEISWDGESKTANLFTAKSITEETTEIITYENKEENLTEEAVNTENDGIDAELLHRGAEFYVTLYSVAALYNSFEGAKTYYDGKIQKALTYSYSEKELEVIFDEAVEECGRYKKVVSELITGNAGTEMINKYDDYIDACIDDFKAMKIYYCTDNYDDISAEEARRKLNISLENADKAFEKFKNAMSEAEEKAAEIGGNGRIGITANLSEAEIEEKENYYNEIGTVVNESLAFMTDIDEVIENPLKFKSASDKIQKKLSSISTPENCMLEKEIMLICCDLMEQAKENVYKGAFRYSGNNEYYIKFEYSVVVFDTLFNIILDKEYNTKYVADDEISNENGLESQII